MRANRVLTLILVALGVAAAQDAAKTWDFQGDEVDDSPAGFSFGKTGQGRAGKWVVRMDPSAPAEPRRRAVERSAEATREISRRTRPPVVEEQDPRLLASHVLVDRDDIDARLPQLLEHGLELVLQHGEVAVDDGVVVGAGERGPRVHAHRVARLRPMHV